MLTLLPVTLRPVKNWQPIKARHDGAGERSGDRPADLFALMGPEIENGTPMIISSTSTLAEKPSTDEFNRKLKKSTRRA